MADQVDIFSNFYIRKPPIITYKRKQTFSSFTTSATTTTTTSSSSLNDFSTDIIKRSSYLENTQGKENIKNGTTLLNKNGFNTPTKTLVPKKDVFDFPEEDNSNSQVEIRIATTFHTNNRHHHSNNNHNHNDHSQHTSSNNKRTIEKVTNGNGLQYKKPALTKPKRPTFSRTKSAPQDLGMMNSNSVNTMIPSSSSILNNNNNKIGSFVLPSSTSSLPSLPSLPNHNNNNKKQQQKRNLVSRLKSADGVCNNESSLSNGLRLYDTINEDSDRAHDNDNDDNDDDDDIFSNRQKHQKVLGDNSIIPQIPTNNNYEQNMEKDIKELLRSELGEEFTNAFNPSDLLLDLSNELLNNNDHDYNQLQQEEKENNEEEEKQRPRYIPENTIRASVTYKRSHHHSRKDNMDSELERQIHELLS